MIFDKLNTASNLCYILYNMQMFALSKKKYLYIYMMFV